MVPGVLLKSSDIFKCIFRLDDCLLVVALLLQQPCYKIEFEFLRFDAHIIIQGGSVMCVRTLSSDPAYTHFSLSCLPNERETRELTCQHIVHQTVIVYVCAPPA